MTRMLSEAELQMQIVAVLNAYGRPDIEWHHVPNGEDRHPATAKRLKKMGVQPGVADLMFLIDGRAHAVELKTERGTQSGAQADWQERLVRAGGTYHIVFGLDDALAALTRIGALRPGISFTTKADGGGVRTGERAGARSPNQFQRVKPWQVKRTSAAGPVSPHSSRQTRRV